MFQNAVELILFARQCFFAMFSDLTSGHPLKTIRLHFFRIYPSLIGLQPDRLRWEWLYWRERAAISLDSAGRGRALGHWGQGRVQFAKSFDSRLLLDVNIADIAVEVVLRKMS